MDVRACLAVLTNTFDDVFEEATLMSRLSFAIGIMKLEVWWPCLDLHSGLGLALAFACV